MNYRRVFIENGYVHLIIVAYNRQPIFIQNINLLKQAIINSKKYFNYELIAICVLPDHIHLILNPENIKDLNKSTLDVKFSYEPSKEYKERVKSQVHGFPSVQNEKESKIETENKSLDFEGNKKIYKDDEDKQKERTKNSEEIKQSGLQSHNLPKETFKDKTIFTNENKKMKRLTYNKTFISEAQVLKKIPDDYKTDGNRFIMRDNSGVEYIIECHKDNNVDFIHTNIVQKIDRNALNEQFKRMKELTEYSTSKYAAGTTNESRLKENDMFVENLNKVKSLK